jgi:predicted Zn-dependent peptidase
VKQPSVTRRAPVDSARVVMSWPLPPMLTRERAAASMAMKQLSRRVGAEVGKRDLALSVEVSTSGGAFAPVAVVALQLTDSAKPEDAVAAVRKAIGKLGTKDAKHELVSINARTVTELVSGFDSLGGRANRFADYLQLVNGERGYFVEDLERHARITDAEIGAAGKRVFDPAAATTLIILPDDAAGDYQQVGLTFASNMTHETSGHEIPVDPAEAAAPLGVPVSKSRLHEARHFTLGNGMDVYLLPSSAVPIIDVRLQFRAGSAAEPDDKAGVAYIAAQMLETDFDRISRSEATDALNFFRVGGEIDVSVTDDSTTFRLVGLEGYSDVLLAGLERVIKVGVYDQDAIENYRKRIAGLLADSEVADFQAHGRALAEAVYGADHPYARRGFWTADSVRRIDMSAARAFKDRYFVASNGSLIITGKFDADLVERHVRYRFGSWPRGDASAHELPSPAGRGSHVGVVNAHSPTVSIDIAYPAPAPGAEYAAWLVLEAMLGGRVAGVREEMGASYGMSADLATHRGPGMLVVSGPVDGRRAGAGLVAVRQAIEELRAGDADFDSSFALARRTVVARLASATNSAGSTGAQLAFTASHRKLPSYLSHLVQEVATLTPKQVRALAARALAPGRQSIVLHGPRAAIQAAFAEAGLTNARIIGR